MGAVTLESQVIAGTATLEGNTEVLTQLAALLVDFEIGFEILPGTKGPGAPDDMNPFEMGPVGKGE